MINFKYLGYRICNTAASLLQGDLFNKMIKKNSILFSVLLPFFLLLLCLKGDFGNFDDVEQINAVKNKYQSFQFSGQPFEFSRTRSLFLTTLSIAKQHDFDLDPRLEIFARGDTGYVNGKTFSWAPPGTALVGSVFFILFEHINLGQFGVYLSVAIMATLVHFLIYKTMISFFTKDEKAALLAAYIYTFATIAFTYSISYFQHQYLSLFILIMLYGLMKTKRSRHVSEGWSYIMPLVFGVSVFFDYPNIVILSPLMIAWLLMKYEIPNKTSKLILLRSSIIVAFLISLLFLFNSSNFGNPLQMSNTLVSIQDLHRVDLENFAENKNDISNIFYFANIQDGLKTYIIDPKRGLFFFCPVLILGLLYISKIWRTHHRATLLLLSIAMSNVLIYSSFSSPSGGSCFGPRYLLPTALVLSIFSALWIRSASGKVLLLISPLLILSILNNLSGSLSTLTIPGNIETIFYGIKNLEFILNNVSGSLIYNAFIAPIPLLAYMSCLLMIILLVFYYLIKPDSKSAM